MEIIDNTSRVQLYYQLYDILLNKIKSGDYKPNDLFPTENELIEKYKVSRITVRKAMDMLSQEGLISKKRGIGTFVKAQKIENNLASIIDFNDNMKNKGYSHFTKVITNKIVECNNNISEALSIPNNTKLINIERLRLMQNEPICLESANLIYDRCPEVLNRDFNNESLRTFIKDNYKIIWKHAKQKITAINADKRISNILNIKKGDPILYIERVSYCTDNIPLEYLEAYYRADMYYFTVDLEY
ncbi:GntR family transcriptional regulator [Brachyspira pilosicoli]|uniref:GntR family transcriptional regulator n=1 Tax=Brachyspira pilosicoli TaxID=52584 RepID=UPI002666CEC9|nr:GntR family transcriptional regulator [Brachyspira pilosicoli]